MKHFIREHEDSVRAALEAGEVSGAFREHHERQIAYLQAERLAHLHVTLAFGLFFLSSFLVAILASSWEAAAVCTAVLILLVPYVFHYALLENAVQRWYRLARQMDRAMGRLPQATSVGRWG